MYVVLYSLIIPIIKTQLWKIYPKIVYNLSILKSKSKDVILYELFPSTKLSKFK